MHQLVEQDLALELSAWFPRIGRALHRCVTCSGGLMHSKELSRDSRIDALCLSLTLSLRSLLPPPPLSRSLYLSIYLPISLSLSPFALSLRCTVAPSWQGCVTKVFRSHRSTTYGAGCLLRPTLPALMIIVFRSWQVLEASCNALAARIRHWKAVPSRSVLPVPRPGQREHWLDFHISQLLSRLHVRTNGPCRTLRSM